MTKVTADKNLNFFPYEINGILFPGMGITYLVEGKEGYPSILCPKGRVTQQLCNMLTAYAVDWYVSGKQCFYYDKSVLEQTLVRTRDYFFNMAALNFVVEENHQWSIR